MGKAKVVVEPVATVVPVVAPKVNRHAYGTPGNTGWQRTRDMPCSPGKLAALQVLADMGATEPGKAVSIADAARWAVANNAKGGLPAGWGWQLGHFAYHANSEQYGPYGEPSTTRLVVVLPNAMGRSHGVYITKAGIAYLANPPMPQAFAPSVVVAPPVESPKPKKPDNKAIRAERKAARAAKAQA